MSWIKSVLIANRGEVAVRIAATLQRMGVRAIAAHSDADAGAWHTRVANVAVRLGPTPAWQSYLDVAAVVEAALHTGADAVHPGYGFLAESPELARAVEAAGLVWIGPPADAIAAMGDKITAKQLAAEAGVPVVPGVHEPGMDDDALAAAAEEVGVPLLVKAAAGGGGKGMRRVDRFEDLPEAVRAARREAASSFGSDALLLERLIAPSRHIEVQVLADAHGRVTALGERECSLQRRHQKVVEEAPSPVVGEELRAEMGAAAVALAKQVGYVGAGTVELVCPADEPHRYCFLEMNTRLQVEHPVTEAVTGLDLVEWQVRVAAGEPLGIEQAAASPRGHAIEARIYAEDPVRGFLPTGGSVLAAGQTAAGCRVDTGVAAGGEVGSDYDPMLAKVIAHGPSRDDALRSLDAGLADYHLLGLITNVAFLRALLANPEVHAGLTDTGLIERERDALVAAAGGWDGGSGAAGARPPDDVLAAAALARRLAREPEPRRAGDADGVVAPGPFDVADGWRLGEPAWMPAQLSWTAANGSEDHAIVDVRGPVAALEVRVDGGEARQTAAERDGDRLAITLQGVTRRWLVADAGGTIWLGCDGRTWALGERSPLAAVRTAAPAVAGPVVAPLPGSVAHVGVRPGDAVAANQPLVTVEAMKMHHPVMAPHDGRVVAVHVAVGDRVAIDQPLVELTADEVAGGI